MEDVEALRRVRAVADYQFGAGLGRVLFPDGVTIKRSKKSGRVRHVYLAGRLLATLRARDGMVALTTAGAERLLRGGAKLHRITIRDEVAKFVAGGRDVFAKHVVEADPELRPRDEAIVTDREGRVLAVGRALLTGPEMLLFKRGVAVKVRRGIDQQ